MKWIMRIALLAVALGASGSAVAQVDFPGPAAGLDLMFRNGQLVTADLRGGYLWRLPLESYSGIGVIGEVGLGLGGYSAGMGPVTMFRCIHAMGCTSVSLQAKTFRPDFVSSWDERWLVGGEISVGIYLFKLTLALFRPRTGESDPLVAFGAGLQLFY